jgi:hypothetical protein
MILLYIKLDYFTAQLPGENLYASIDLFSDFTG